MASSSSDGDQTERKTTKPRGKQTSRKESSRKPSNSGQPNRNQRRRKSTRKVSEDTSGPPVITPTDVAPADDAQASDAPIDVAPEGAQQALGFGLPIDSENELAHLGLPDWIVVERAIGHDPWNRSGANFDAYAALGIRVICRLVHAPVPQGTLPFSQNYGAFARRCANFIAASSGCQIWIIGNEPNRDTQWPAIVPATGEDAEDGSVGNEATEPAPAQSERLSAVHDDAGDLSPASSFETSGNGRSWWDRLIAPLRSRVSKPVENRPGASNDGEENPRAVDSEVAPVHAASTRNPGEASPAYAEVITPRKYVACYRLCRRAIRAVPGHENDMVLPAGLAPWINHASYAANPEGDWVTYFRHVIGLLSAQECDGLALHIYTRPAENSGQKESLEELADLLAALPASMQALPVFVTQCGPVAGWASAPEGWWDQFVDSLRAFWADRPNPLRMCAPARRTDGAGVLDPVVAASIGLVSHLRPGVGEILRLGGHSGPAHAPIRGRDIVVTTTVVNLRGSPGYLDKGPDDVIAELAGGVRLEIRDDGSTAKDGLAWWQARVAQGADTRHSGWVAETGPDGRRLLMKATGTTAGNIQQGSRMRSLLPVRVRRSQGYVGKPDNDVLGEAPAGSIWQVTAGPARADDLTWWEVEGETALGSLRGWVAETAPGGLQLFTLEDGEESGRGMPPTESVGQFRPGDRLITLAYVRLRRSAGYLNKVPEDVIADIWSGTDVLILTEAQTMDELVWYEVETRVPEGSTVRGWMAERSPEDLPLLGMREERYEENFALGELIAVGTSPLRVRRSPGVHNKGEEDVLGEYYPRTTLNVLSGTETGTQAVTETVDDMRWWRVGGIATHGAVRGWVAQSTAQGVVLVRRPPNLPGTSIPNRGTGTYLHRPFAGRFGISQLWGERQQFYARFTYDGVPLLGHNGIDFLTPMGTPILATDSGVVAAAAFEPGGFGHYVLLDHAWGQSIYAHLDAVAVGNGQTVTRGQTLGQSGNSGNSSGAHLHFAIRIHPYDRADGWGGFADPLPYMSPADVILPAYVQDEALQGVWPQALLDLMNVEPLPPPGMAEEVPGMVRP